jgi:CheY-like chemotaxis protein
MMPVMGGAELVRRIRDDPRMKAIPIVVLTGSGREKALEELGDAARHVNAVLVKPVKLSDLQRALEAALAET